jgi:UDP-N-acetylglucosamine acyltransferase
MAAGGSIVLRDIPAYVMASGQSASAHGLNSEGLKRRGFDQDAIRALKDAYRTIYRKGLRLAEALEVLEVQAANVPEVRVLLDSLKRSERGIVR